MHNRSLPKIINGLLTLLMLNAGLAASFTRTNVQTQSGNSFANQASADSALISVGRHGVSTESGSDRVSLISKIRIKNYVYPVTTALGTDLITKLGHSTSAQQVDDRLLSPRLVALRDRIKSGDREALDNFWKEISERGAPIVEPAAGKDRHMLVKMVWRAREETKNGFVFRLGDLSKPMD